MMWRVPNRCYPPDNNYAGSVPTYLNFGTVSGNAQFTVEAWIEQYFYTGGGNAIVALGYRLQFQ